MNQERFKNLYEAFTSQTEYLRFVESSGKEKINPDKCNFKLLSVLYGGFLLTLIIEKYFSFKREGEKSSLIPEYIKVLVNNIATYKDGRYYLGDTLSYADEFTILEKVRNKLAHGDFIIEGDNVVFEEKITGGRTKGKINISKLISSLSSLETFGDSYQSSIIRSKKFYNIQHRKVREVKTEKDIIHNAKYIYLIEIEDHPIVPAVRNSEYTSYRDELYKYLCDFLCSVPQERIEEAALAYLKCIKTPNMKVTVKATRLCDLDNFEILKKKYLENKSVFSKFGLKDQVKFMTMMADGLDNGQYQKYNIAKGLGYNLYFLNGLDKNPDYSLLTLIRNLGNIYMYFLRNNEIVLSSYLVGFNAIYEYGLEKEFTKGNNNSLIMLLQNKILDFSKLNLDVFDSDDLVIEHEFSSYMTDIDNYLKRETDRLDAWIAKKEENKKRYSELSHDDEETKKNKIKMFNDEIRELLDEKRRVIEEVEELRIKASSFDLDKYTRNYNIIMHIRNAIAHGNIFVDSYTSDMLKTEIIIKDYDNDGVLVYEKKMKIQDFITLFSAENISFIFDFIISNIEDKSDINPDYFREVHNKTLRKIDGSKMNS